MRVLEVNGLTTAFGTTGFLSRSRLPFIAVNNVSFALHQGEILGVVGQSGSGKSTLAKTVLGLYREQSGSIELDGKVVSGVNRYTARKLRAEIQYVHQDPGAALDPWWTIGSTMHESLIMHSKMSRTERQRKIDEMLDAVGLAPTYCKRYPHELSGGQQRRIGLARTLILNPRIVLLDEPTAELDLSVQATVLKLFSEIQEQFRLSYIFVSHDLAVVRRLCDRVLVMLNGEIVEHGETSMVITHPKHPYTTKLIQSVPHIDFLAQETPTMS